MLGSGRGRLNGSLFGIGFLLSQTIVLVVAVLLGSAATPDRDRNHETLAAALELGLGVVLLFLAARGQAGSRTGERARESRTEALLTRLGGLRPATAVGVGLLLGVGGVKRLTITLIAGATIAVAALTPSQEVALGIAYVVIASALVWFPVGVYLVAGRRADAWAARARAWLIAHEHGFTVVSTAVFGVLLAVHGLVLLL